MAARLESTYSPQDVIVSVGPVILTGFSDGDAVTARASDDVSTMRTGLDGGVARTINASHTGEFEFRLLQAAGANTQLTEIFNTNDLSNRGRAVVPVSIVHVSGAEVAVATEAWLKTMPEMTFGKETGERVWVLSCADLRMSF